MIPSSSRIELGIASNPALLALKKSNIATRLPHSQYMRGKAKDFFLPEEFSGRRKTTARPPFSRPM
jgi:hypothetical protein